MYIFVDVETNGIGTFRPPTQTITQLSYIKTDDNRNIIKTYSKLIKGATELADISQVVFTLDQINKEGVELKDALLEFQNELEDYPCFIAHNAEFDFLILKNNIPVIKANTTEILNSPIDSHEFQRNNIKMSKIIMIKEYANVHLDAHS